MIEKCLVKSGAMVDTKIYTIDELTGMLKPIMARDFFRGHSIFDIAEELHEASGKRVDVYERSELPDASPLLEAIEVEDVTIWQRDKCSRAWIKHP